MTRPRSDPLPVVPLAILLWIPYAAVEIVLGYLANQGGLREAGLDFGHKLALVATDLAMGIAALLTSCGLTAFVLRSTGGRWFVRIPWALVLVVALVLYFASWTSFWMTTQFVDIGGLALWYASSLQFLQHVTHISPWLLVAAPLAGVLLGVAGPWLLRRIFAAISDAHRGTLVRAGIGAGVLAVCIAAWGQFVYATSSEPARLNVQVVPQAVGPVYRYVRDQRTGPLPHILADLADRLFRSEEALERYPGIEVIRRPQIELSDWVTRVDRTAMKRWNVILLIIESLRPDQLVATGGKREIMPTVDAIARESIVPRRCYAQASHSDYADLCPLGSHYPLRGREKHVYPESPPYPRVLFYDLLKPLGWRTAIFSSQNETWGQMHNYLTTGSLDHFLHSETYDGETRVERDDTGFSKWMKGDKRAGKIDDRFTVNEAIEWINADDAPFCIYMNLQNSHVPYEVPADFPRRFGPDPKELDFPILFASFPPKRAAEVMGVYANSLAYVDAQIGRLVADLKRTGRWDQTLMVVTGDTGQAFYEHGFASHASHIFDEVMQVPLIIRAPSRVSRRLNRTAEHVDVLPTMLNLLGLPPHPSCQGLDLLADEFPDPRSSYVLVQNGVFEEYGIIQGDYKLIRFVRWDHEMLFDLASDPGEQHDILGRNPEVADRLRRRLQTWRREQIDYYADPSRLRSEYPPVLKHEP